MTALLASGHTSGRTTECGSDNPNLGWLCGLPSCSVVIACAKCVFQERSWTWRERHEVTFRRMQPLTVGGCSVKVLQRTMLVAALAATFWRRVVWFISGARRRLMRARAFAQCRSARESTPACNQRANESVRSGLLSTERAQRERRPVDLQVPLKIEESAAQGQAQKTNMAWC